MRHLGFLLLIVGSFSSPGMGASRYIHPVLIQEHVKQVKTVLSSEGERIFWSVRTAYGALEPIFVLESRAPQMKERVVPLLSVLRHDLVKVENSLRRLPLHRNLTSPVFIAELRRFQIQQETFQQRISILLEKESSSKTLCQEMHQIFVEARILGRTLWTLARNLREDGTFPAQGR